MSRGSARANMVLVAISLLASIVIAEWALRSIAPWDAFKDRRTDEYWVAFEQHRKDDLGREAVADVVSDEILGWKMRPRWTREGVSHNALGWRASAESLEPPAGMTRVMVIGDSFTYGLGVRDEETYAAQLAKLSGAQVLNAGVNAFGVDQAVLMWETQGQRFKPTAVVLGYYVDDFYRNLLAVRDRPKPRFAWNESERRFELRSVEQARQRRTEIQQRPWGLGDLRLAEATWWLWRKSLTKLTRVEDQTLRSGAELSEFLLQRLSQSVSGAGARLIVVFIGEWYGSHAETAWIEESVMRSCTELAITCINLAKETRAAGLEVFYGPDRHFSVVGHRLAAERISQALLDTTGPPGKP